MPSPTARVQRPGSIAEEWGSGWRSEAGWAIVSRMPRHPRVAATSGGLSDRVYSPLADRARRMPGPIYPLHIGDTSQNSTIVKRDWGEGQVSRIRQRPTVSGVAAQ